MSQTHTAAINLIRIAAQLRQSEPVLARELTKSTRHLFAIQNPNRGTLEQQVTRALKALESMRDEVKASLDKFKTTEEFEQMFKKALPGEDELEDLSAFAAPEIEDLTAEAELEDQGQAKTGSQRRQADYGMSQEDMDKLVEEGEWPSEGEKVQEETEKKNYFFKDVDLVRRLLETARKGKSTKSNLEKILETIEKAIRDGNKIVEKHVPKAEHSKEEVKAKAPAPRGDRVPPLPKKEEKQETKSDVKAPAPKEKSEGGAEWDKKRPMLNLGPQVQHYTEMLNENIDDDVKLVKTLKEFFHTVKPALASKTQRMLVLPPLIKVAQRNERAAKVLVPIIRKISGR
jgi:hypothetical protein